MRGMKVHQHHNRNMSYSVKGNIAQFAVYLKKKLQGFCGAYAVLTIKLPPVLLLLQTISCYY